VIDYIGFQPLSILTCQHQHPISIKELDFIYGQISGIIFLTIQNLTITIFVGHNRTTILRHVHLDANKVLTLDILVMRQDRQHVSNNPTSMLVDKLNAIRVPNIPIHRMIKHILRSEKPRKVRIGESLVALHVCPLVSLII